MDNDKVTEIQLLVGEMALDMSRAVFNKENLEKIKSGEKVKPVLLLQQEVVNTYAKKCIVGGLNYQEFMNECKAVEIPHKLLENIDTR